MDFTQGPGYNTDRISNGREEKNPELSRFGGMLLVTFSSGEKRLPDTTLLRGGAFEPLRDEEIFSNPVIFHGVITWKDGENVTKKEVTV